MKIRSLLLGSVAAAAGLSTGAYAADLGVLTSLDVCDALGLSGLTISSDSNCLQITGEVKYVFKYGDYADPKNQSGTVLSRTRVDIETSAGTKTYDYDNGYTDWESRFDAWIRFAASADSDFGKAQAVIKLKEVDDKMQAGYSSSVFTALYGSSTGSTTNATITVTGTSGTATIVGTATGATITSTISQGTSTYTYAVSGVSGSDTGGVIMDEAYVSIGDSTIIMAGKKGSIFKKGDDEPLNWLGLFNSEKVDAGVGGSSGSPNSDYYKVDIADGGHVIQVTSDLGNGISVAAGLENLNGSTYTTAGTAVGVLSYAGDGISAHVSFKANGILAGEVQDWLVHAGFAGTFDNFKIVGAAYFDSSEYWNVLASASATFDMFTIAASAEATADESYGVGASLSATVTDGVTLNVGGRFYHAGTDGDDSYEVAAGVVAAVTENLTLTGKVAYVSDDYQNLFYGQAKLEWAPGGGTFTTAVTGTVNSEGGYKLESEFKKTFQ